MFDLVLTLVIQKRCQIVYNFDEDKLERMMVEMEGGSDPTMGEG